MASSRERCESAARSFAPICHLAPVSSRTAALPASGSATTRSMAITSATSGVCRSPPSPTTSTGRPLDRKASASGAASALRRINNRCRGRRAVFGTSRLVFFGDLLRNPLTFLFDVSEQRQSNVSGDGSLPRTKCADGHTASAQRCRRQVCQFESLRRVTPTGEQFERRSRLSVGKREVGCKPWQVGRRRASPTVDRLHRIADGCQRQPAVGSPHRTNEDNNTR